MWPAPPSNLVLQADGHITMADGSDPAHYLQKWASEHPNLQFPLPINVVDHTSQKRLVQLANFNLCA